MLQWWWVSPERLCRYWNYCYDLGKYLPSSNNSFVATWFFLDILQDMGLEQQKSNCKWNPGPSSCHSIYYDLAFPATKLFYTFSFRSTHLWNIVWRKSDKLSGIAVSMKWTDYNVINEHVRNINQFIIDRYEDKDVELKQISSHISNQWYVTENSLLVTK